MIISSFLANQHMGVWLSEDFMVDVCCDVSLPTCPHLVLCSQEHFQSPGSSVVQEYLYSPARFLIRQVSPPTSGQVCLLVMLVVSSLPQLRD